VSPSPLSTLISSSHQLGLARVYGMQNGVKGKEQVFPGPENHR
jgi:hypothetical protein